MLTSLIIRPLKQTIQTLQVHAWVNAGAIGRSECPQEQADGRPSLAMNSYLTSEVAPS